MTRVDGLRHVERWKSMLLDFFRVARRIVLFRNGLPKFRKERQGPGIVLLAL